MKEQDYALVDRAIQPNILDLVEHYDGDAWCLFTAPVDEEFALVAPYLVKLTPELNQYLIKLERPWGFIFTSSADNKALTKHLRGLLSVYIEDNDVPTFFRFYDPRVLWSVLDCLTPSQQYFFAGPMARIQTSYPKKRGIEFESYPLMHQPPKHITLNREQYSAILAQCYKNLEQDLAFLFYQHQVQGKKDNSVAEVFAKQLIEHLSDWGISVALDIKSVAQYCVDSQITEWERVPATWKTLLSNQYYPAPYRVKALIMNLGGSNEL
ncbi:DUF4123 domain-containing protein [Vibrio sp. C8]